MLQEGSQDPGMSLFMAPMNPNKSRVNTRILACWPPPQSVPAMNHRTNPYLYSLVQLSQPVESLWHGLDVAELAV